MDGDDRLDAMQATQVVQPTSGEENMLEQVVTPEPPRPHRPRNRTQADFRDLEDPRLRHAALKEYNPNYVLDNTSPNP